MKKIAHVLVLPKMAGSQKFCHMLLSKIEGYEKFVLVSECEDVDFEQRAEFIKNFESINVNVIWCKIAFVPNVMYGLRCKALALSSASSSVCYVHPGDEAQLLFLHLSPMSLSQNKSGIQHVGEF